jgi:hypothetical protein
VLLIGGSVTFNGVDFTPNSTVAVYFQRGAGTKTFLKNVSAGCSGAATVTVSDPGGVLQTDHVYACDVRKPCATGTITVI